MGTKVRNDLARRSSTRGVGTDAGGSSARSCLGCNDTPGSCDGTERRADPRLYLDAGLEIVIAETQRVASFLPLEDPGLELTRQEAAQLHSRPGMSDPRISGVPAVQVIFGRTDVTPRLSSGDLVTPEPTVSPPGPAVYGAPSIPTQPCSMSFPLCSPYGPPYSPPCAYDGALGGYFYFHGNQLQKAPSPAVFVNAWPWRFVGKVAKPSSGEGGGGTGTYVGVGTGGTNELRHYVLAAAHSVFPGAFPSYIEFALARNGQCIPYGVLRAKRVWVPKVFVGPTKGYPGPESDEHLRANDYALIEIDDPEMVAATGVPAAQFLPLGSYLPPASWAHLAPRTVGYSCGREPDQPLATGGVMPGLCRQANTPYVTAAPETSIVGWDMYPDGSMLVRTTLEGTVGMSGGPVWVEAGSVEDIQVLGGPTHLIGVAIGSPCQLGTASASENWVAALTPTALSRIASVIDTGSHPDLHLHQYANEGCVVVGQYPDFELLCWGEGGGVVGTCSGL